MKKFLIPMFALVAISLTAFQYQAQTIQNSCKSSESRKAAKVELEPYQYDAGKTNTFTFKNKVQQREIEVPLFIGERYRFVFNTEGLPQPIDIEIYDKKAESKNRTLLFSNKDNKDDRFLIFEPEKSKKLYVNYIVPVTNDTIKKGCVVMVVGYQSKFKKS